jgi:hypothetical protein
VNIPSPTSEQRKCFEEEFAEYWNEMQQRPGDNNTDRTDMESMWVKARAYSEGLTKPALVE